MVGARRLRLSLAAPAVTLGDGRRAKQVRPLAISKSCNLCVACTVFLKASCSQLAWA